MGFNKAKALQEAHKYVTQGKTARAIKQYQWIVENEPSDLTLLNVIGDLYAQDNNIPQALKYFYKLADAYAREGFKVKANAIYKKISKIDRNTAEPLLKLAELNASQGHGREAREQYKNALGFFERTGETEKALGVLRELCQLDPNSHGMRMKLAQVTESAGGRREAVDVYLEAAVLARQSGDAAAAENALNKAAELAPENPKVHLQRAQQALANQRPEEVKSILDSVQGLQNNAQAKRLLLESYLTTRNVEAAKGLLLNVFQSNSSDFSPVARFAEHCIEKQQYEMALDALKAISPDLIARRETAPLMETIRRLWKSSPQQIDALELAYQVAEKTADEAAIPEILEALGNAQVQSDQLDKAEQAYSKLVAREPENETYKDLLKQVLEKQGKQYVAQGQTPFISSDVGLDAESAPTRDGAVGGPVGDPEQATVVERAITNSDFFVRDGLMERAVEELERVLRIYPDQIEIHKRIVEICQEKLPRRAVQAAEVLARVYSGQGDSSAAMRYHEEALELAQTAAAAEAAPSPPSEEPSQARHAEMPGQPPASVEINLSQLADGDGNPEEEAQLPPPQEISLQFETLQAAERASSNTATSQEILAGKQVSSGSARNKSDREKASSFNYEESREEIEFYIRHGFYDEARKAVSELEEKFPDEDRVADLRRRVGELIQAPGPSAAFGAEAVTAAKEKPGQGLELPTTFSEPAEGGGQNEAVEHLAAELASTLEELHGAATAPSASAAGQEYTAPRSAEDASAVLGSLLDELNDDNGPAVQTADDVQTHYNLGVAFREMGLLDEAIGEFQKVVNSGGPERFGPNFLQACTLLASCFMDKEMPTIAANWYSRALETPGLDHEGMLAIYYDLGVAFEKAGDTTTALEKFTEVYSQNIDYRDVAEKIRLLRQSAR